MHYRLLVDLNTTDADTLEQLKLVLLDQSDVRSCDIQLPEDRNITTAKEIVAVILLGVAANHATDISKDVIEKLAGLDYVELIAMEPIDPDTLPDAELPDGILPRTTDED